ncbi:MAG TPA: NB-ARC domain-containing protein [Ignavibacteria bacterium]
MHIAGKHQNIDTDAIQECFIENGLYFFTSNKLSFIKPLLICKDGIILFYNKFDSAHKKIICTAPLSRELYIKTSANNISELFYLDSESLSIKPLNIDIKISKNGTCHNLPSQDYKEFIGRKKELELLNSAILHPRHFITALDGIGGVGKSAISLELCNKILEAQKDEDIYFEFIIWVSAKTTKLENGKIIKLTQSFEHLAQLLDTILDVLSFSEYKNFDYKIKTKLVCELLEQTKALIILDNLETVKKDNLQLIWDFINKIPVPSKVLLTSREYHYDVSQHVSINKLSDDDAREFIVKYCLNIGLDYTKIENYASQISSLSSGLPIAISSIIGQIYLGRSLNAIKNSIEKNQDDLAKFCFQDQLNLLDIDHKKVLLILCLSNEDLDFEAISYMIEPELRKPLQNAVKELKSLSLMSINNINGTDIYYILPLIKNYILNTYIDEELRKYIESKLREFYQLKDIDSYNLFPYEEIALDKSSLIPRKLADKAIKHAEIGEFEQAEQYFKKVTKEYSQESYGWYIYSLYNAQYKSNYPEAINCLKKANDIKPNYLYNKKIGDYNLKLKNYDAAIVNYKMAHSIATIIKNKNEMLYSIGNAQFEKVKYIRRLINRNGLDKQNERNESYKQLILNFENYLDATEEIYDGKKIKIFRCLSEAYLGLKNKDLALDYINKAIELSEGDQTHINFRNIINK